MSGKKSSNSCLICFLMILVSIASGILFTKLWVVGALIAIRAVLPYTIFISIAAIIIIGILAAFLARKGGPCQDGWINKDALYPCLKKYGICSLIGAIGVVLIALLILITNPACIFKIIQGIFGSAFFSLMVISLAALMICIIRMKCGCKGGKSKRE